MEQAFVDLFAFITDDANKWNPNRFRYQHVVDTITSSGNKLKFKYNYQLGTALVVGDITSDDLGFEILYISDKTIQIYIYLKDAEPQFKSFPPHQKDEAVEWLSHYANL